MLDYELSDEAAPQRCKVVLTGEIGLEEGCAMLERMWNDPPYAESRSAIWDVSACELPDFNDLLKTAKYINQHKSGRGPTYVAFLSPAFASSALARAFRGFDRVINLDLNFFSDHEAATQWLDKRELGR